jgi:uncharacterized protein (TIGR00730 family)
MKLCVYCGSSFGADPAFLDAARATARLCAERGIEIVYGGAKVGLMGAVADAALAAGGRVTGIIPRALVDREIAHEGLSEMHVVDSMHERKALMAELSTAFVALPGGPGTLDEIVEQWTWALLGIHDKPCGFLSVKGYFDPFREMTRRIVEQQFLDERFARMLVFTEDPAELIARFESYAPPPPKWSEGAKP